MWKHKWLVISLVLAVFMAFFRFGHGTVQQDNYIGYAQMIPNVIKISFFDSRLLPGLPILIYSIAQVVRNFYLAGYIVTTLSFIGSYFLLYKITGSKLSVLPLIFPPILFNLASLIDTEFPFIFLTLLGIYLIKNKRAALAFLAIGLSVWFRLAGFAVLFGVFIDLLLRKDFKKFLIGLPYFAVPVILLMFFNIHFFGSQNPFYQIFTYGALIPGRIDVGIIQLGIDLVRAFRWGWYRILFSGICYIIFFIWLWLKSIKIKSLEFWVITGIYTFTLIINSIPFLENLGRYLAPTAPLFWIIFYPKFKSSKILYLILPLSVAVVLF